MGRGLQVIPIWLRRSRARQRLDKPVTHPSGSGAAPRVEDPSGAMVREADRLRDAGEPAAAATAYAAVLAAVPDRTDLRIQLGNMLKDSGQLSAAEEAYRRVLEVAGDDPDAHLQLGHVLKLRGQRAAAMASYRRAAELDPASPAAVAELAALGDPGSQERLFATRAGAVERVAAVTGELLEMRRTVDRLLAGLPDLASYAAFPIALYAAFRSLFQVPPPPCAASAGRAAPTVTVLLRADREPLETLWTQLRALQGQEHRSWKALFVGGDPARKQAVLGIGAIDGRIAWADVPAGTSVEAAEAQLGQEADTDWVLLPMHGAVLDRQALGWIAYAGSIAEAAAFVCDEEVGTPPAVGDHCRVRFSDPVLRQVVDYDALLEANVCGGTVAVRQPALREVAGRLSALRVPFGRSALLLELASRSAVGHLPFPLVWRTANDHGSGRIDAEEHRAAVAAHLSARGSAAAPNGAVDGGEDGPLPVGPRVTWRPTRPDSTVWATVPTRDNAADAVAFVSGLYGLAARPDRLAVRVVDNGSNPAEAAALAALAERDGVRVVRDGRPFNWSGINNRAAAEGEEAGAHILLFANDDMRMLTPGWDDLLRGLLDRPEVGAVGARLLYPDDTIQHAGVLFGWQGSVIHDGLHEPASAPGPACRWRVTRAASAVTGAFLATRTEVFRRVGGFDEASFPVAYNDVDFCLKVRSQGMRVLWTPGITLYHYESKTRGLDHLDAAKAARNSAERTVLEHRWGDALDSDPGVNPLWFPATLPFRLVAAPSEARLHAYIVRCGSSQPWKPAPPLSHRVRGTGSDQDPRWG